MRTRDIERLLKKAGGAYTRMAACRPHGPAVASPEYDAARTEFLGALGELRGADVPRATIAQRLNISGAAVSQWTRQAAGR